MTISWGLTIRPGMICSSVCPTVLLKIGIRSICHMLLERVSLLLEWSRMLLLYMEGLLLGHGEQLLLLHGEHLLC